MAIAPDGTWLATGGEDQTVRIWDRASACTETLTDHSGPVRSVAIAPDGTWLATGGEDQTVRIWDRGSDACTATLTGHSGPVCDVAIARDGTWLATVGGTVRIWDQASRTCTDTYSGYINRHYSNARAYAVAISPNGTWLVAGYDHGLSMIYYRPEGASRTILLTDGVTGAIAIASDGTWFATGDSWGQVKIWAFVPTKRRLATIAAHDGPVRSVAISPDSTLLATAGADNTVRIWDVAAQRALAVARTDGDLYSCVWGNADGELAVAGERGLYLFAFLT